MSALTKLVQDKIDSFATSAEAADFFGVTPIVLETWKMGAPVPVAAVEKSFDFSKMLPKVGQVVVQNELVCLAFPWYKLTNPGTAFSVLSLHDRTKMTVMMQFGDAFIAHTRNQLASEFLKSKAQWMLTVDDDMVLPCGNAKWFNSFTNFDLPEAYAGLNTVNRLLSHGKTLVGALYFGRWRHGKPVYAEGAADKTEEAFARKGPHNIVKPTKWVGTGAMLIHRSVYTAIEDKFPNLARNKDGDFGNWFTSSEHDLRHATSEALTVLGDEAVSETARLKKVESLLSIASHKSKAHSSLGTGEDVQFCIRATQAGHQPHVDLGLICGHQGSFVFGQKKAGWVK